MINEKELEQFKQLCNKYRIKYQFFNITNIILLDSGFEQWMIRYVHNRDKPYCLMHKNKLKQTEKFHVQRWVKNITFAFDTIISHKNILVNLYGSSNTYHKNTNIKNTNKDKRRKQFCQNI